MNQSASLHRLQTIDHQIDQFSSQIAKIVAKLSDNSDKQQLFDDLTIEINTLHNQIRELKEISFITSMLRIKIDQSEISLYSGSIKNPKELQDLQNEITSLKKQLVASEENELAKMILLETQETTTAQKQGQYDAFMASKLDSDKELTQNHTSISRELEVLRIEREATEKSLQNNDLGVYNKLRKQKAGVAVVSVEENACSSCGAEISHAEWQKARISPDLVFCQGCGRIIYAK